MRGEWIETYQGFSERYLKLGVERENYCLLSYGKYSN